jgi:cytoskeletal protein CcmA (bactofilin family)
MLGNFGRSLDNGHDSPVARTARILEPTPPARLATAPARPDPARPDVALRADLAAKPETISSIGSGMSITGNIVCDGPMQVHGRIEGELKATEVFIGDSAQVEGNIVAQDLTVRGRVKGTIRAVRVKLQGNGTVEGDIFHRSLSIDEHALFEGSSRRVENPIEGTATDARQSNAQLRGMLKQNLQSLGDAMSTTSGT